MFHIKKNAWAAVVAGLSGCAAVAMLLGEAGRAEAESRPVRGGQDPKIAARMAEQVGAHSSVIRVDDRSGPVHKPLKIGHGKSVLLEFTRDLRDVMVSNPEAVDAVMLSSNKVFLLAKKLGESNAFFFDANGDQFATFEVYVERDSSGLEALLARLIPGSKIKIEMMNDTVILTGTVRTPSDSNMANQIAEKFGTVERSVVASPSALKAGGVEIKSQYQAETKGNYNSNRVINMLAVDGEEQVMLRVVVAEVQRSLLKQFGVNLGFEVNSGNLALGMLTANSLPLTTAAGLGKLPNIGTDNTKAMGSGCTMVGDQLKTNVVGNSGPYGFWGTGNNCIGYALRALERDGLVKTLAEPNLTAVSGEPAKFLAGGEYPVPTVDSTGNINVVFKEFGISVAFTPIVMSEGRISLKIETEVSELTSDGAVSLSNLQIPALKKRQSKSTVELPSGGSLAMAGLISEDTRQNIDGFPGMKDLPVLGTLFRSRDFIKSETELVVIVTPYLVKPTSRQELARPMDGLGDATDLKANFLGHINRIYGRSNAMPSGDLKGDYGFIVE